MPQKRRESILQILSERQAVSVRQLAQLVYASEASVRRDAAALEKEGVVRRMHGSVMLASCENSVVPLSVRDGDHAAQKERLARQAAAMVSDGDTLLMDASSTVRRMAKHLAGKKDLTIITNNDGLLTEPGLSQARIYCTGGEYLRENHAFAGPAAERFVRGIRADKLFFSSQGLSKNGEVSDHSEVETSLRQAMLERAGVKICLMDDSKLGRQCRFRVCGKEDIDRFLCEQELPWESHL